MSDSLHFNYVHNQEERFQNKLLQFTDILREAGILISIFELKDMFLALQNIDYSDGDIFRQTLSSTLVKNHTDIPIFNRCYNEFFKGIPKPKPPGENEKQGLELNSSIAMKDLQELLIGISKNMDKIPVETLRQESAENIFDVMYDNNIPASLSASLNTLFSQISMAETLDRFALSYNLGYNDLKDNLMLPLISTNLKKRIIGNSLSERENQLLNKKIYQLSSDEILEMQELIIRLGQKLKNRISLRKKKVKHGGLDVKKTSRHNLRYGGIPFNLFLKDRKIVKPNLVVLCDISSSVNQYSRFMLLLTYTLQSLFSKVRSFVFISNMLEITDRFREMDHERAINSIFSDTSFSYGFWSNYGNSFSQLVNEYGSSLTSKTTVIILGDARNNNQDPRLDYFLKIKERSKKVYWLNPDKRNLWDWGDSIASIYREYCTEMKEVSNFRDLADFIDNLLYQYH